jgi:hypothetical protein
MASSYPEKRKSAVDYRSVKGDPEKAESLLDEIEDESSFSELRLRIGWKAAFPTNNHFQSSDFRNPLTGESVIPAEVYFKLASTVFSVRDAGNRKMFALIAVLYFTVLITPLLVIGFIPSLEDSKVALYSGLVIMFVVARGIYNAVAPRIYKRLDSQIQTLIEEQQNAFLESYGVGLGYQVNTAKYLRYWKDDSHVWLRRPRQPQPPAEAAASADCVGGAASPLPDEFPPIYILSMVPGDINISESCGYHPSLQVDEATWKLIQTTHKETMKMPIIQGLILLFVLVWIPYFLFFTVIVDAIGYPQALGGLGVYFCVFYLLFVWVRSVTVARYNKITETVTRILNTRRDEEENVVDEKIKDILQDYTFNEQMAGYSLELKTSALPGRPGATSQRYQLVRRSKTVNSSSSHGGEVLEKEYSRAEIVSTSKLLLV